MSGILTQDHSHRFLVAIPPGSDRVLLLLREGAAPDDVLQGFCVALMRGWNQQMQQQEGAAEQAQWPPEAQLALAKSTTWAVAVAGFPAFCQALARAGYAIDRVSLSQGETRLLWGEEVRVRQDPS